MITIKVAIITDIHGNVVALREVLKDAERNNADEYLFLGDLVNDLPFGNETLELIKKTSNKVIKGNKEQYLIDYEKYNLDWENVQFRNLKFMYDELTPENLEYIRNLPEQLVVELEGVKIRMVHGSPSAIDEQIKHKNFELIDKYAKELKEDVLLFGHSHEKMWYENIDGKLLINAGCCGVSPFHTAQAEYVIIEVKNGKVQDIEFRLVDYNLNEVKKKIEESGILKEDKVLMNLTYQAISGKSDKRYNFFVEAKKIRQERNDIEKIEQPNLVKKEKGIYNNFKLFDDDIWLGLADKYKEDFIFI